MAKQIKLKPTQRLDLNWMINKTCLEVLPEYQDGSDTLLFRDNFKEAADDFRNQQKENRKFHFFICFFNNKLTRKLTKI